MRWFLVKEDFLLIYKPTKWRQLIFLLNYERPSVQTVKVCLLYACVTCQLTGLPPHRTESRKSGRCEFFHAEAQVESHLNTKQILIYKYVEYSLGVSVKYKNRLTVLLVVIPYKINNIRYIFNISYSQSKTGRIQIGRT